MARGIRTSRSLALLSALDALCREMARLTLQAEGYDVMEVDGGELGDALIAFLPAVLVLDEATLVRLPSKAGFEDCSAAPNENLVACSASRSRVVRRATAPTVILLSAASPLSVARDVHDRAHTTTFVPAPWSPIELSRAARRVRHAIPVATQRSGCS